MSEHKRFPHQVITLIDDETLEILQKVMMENKLSQSATIRMLLNRGINTL